MASYSSTTGQDGRLDSRKQAGIVHHSDRRDTLGHTNMKTTLKKSSKKQGFKRYTKCHHCDRSYKCRVIKGKKKVIFGAKAIAHTKQTDF